MDYSGADAITPEQLGRVHWTIENEIEEYQPCYYSTSSVNITTFTNNKAYIAETVSIPSSSDIVVDDHKALYVNCSTFTVNGKLEIKLGSQLRVNTVPKCN